MTLQAFRILLVAMLSAVVLSIPAYWLTRRVRLLDIPGSAPHKSHRATVPVSGGVVILISLLLTGWASGAFASATVRAILIPASIVFFFGLWDDFRRLSPLWKLSGQILATMIMIWLGVQIRLFDQLPWLNIGITFLWMVGITNAYNFVDSMDGLATGLATLAAGFFALVTFDSNQADLSILSTVLLGICIGVFYYTAVPAKYFLGDSGAQYLGFLLAGLAIAYNPLGFLRIQSWYVPILLVGIPIFDTALVVFSRLRRGRSIYQASLDHTYHRLVALGLDSNRAVLSMHFLALILGCIAFVALSLPPVPANIVFAACLLCGLGGVLFLDSRRRWP